MDSTGLHLEQLQLFAVPPHRGQMGYVYAVLMTRHQIKIGWTGRSPRTRARELNGQLLAYAFGTRADEERRHEQLATWRIGRTEDFWPAPDVWRVVAELRTAEPKVLELEVGA
jgi:hypothetical protein